MKTIDKITYAIVGVGVLLAASVVIYGTSRSSAPKTPVPDVTHDIEATPPLTQTSPPPPPINAAPAVAVAATPPPTTPPPTLASPAPPAPNAATIETVRNGIVGVWNGVWDEPNMRVSYIISFDSEGRITEKGLNSGGMLLGGAGPREGKVKYRLEANKDGAGVVIVETDEKGTESPIYVVDQIGAETVTMRSMNPQTKRLNEPVVWKRIKKEPYAIEAAK